jgi:hypothetical protein
MSIDIALRRYAVNCNVPGDGCQRKFGVGEEPDYARYILLQYWKKQFSSMVLFVQG